MCTAAKVLNLDTALWESVFDLSAAAGAVMVGL